MKIEHIDIVNNEVILKLVEFIETEAKSCSMDLGCVTPEYVYRMWGGKFSIEEIENGLTELRIKGVFMVHGNLWLKVKGSR